MSVPSIRGFQLDSSAIVGAGGEAAAGAAAANVADLVGDESANAAADAAISAEAADDAAGGLANAGDVAGNDDGGMIMDTAQGPIDPGGGGPAVEEAPPGALPPVIENGIQGGQDAPLPPEANGGGAPDALVDAPAEGAARDAAEEGLAGGLGRWAWRRGYGGRDQRCRPRAFTAAAACLPTLGKIANPDDTAWI